MKSVFSVALTAMFLWTVGMAMPMSASAADCERSFLDKRYCDIDGNLTADLPIDQNNPCDLLSTRNTAFFPTNELRFLSQLCSSTVS